MNATMKKVAPRGVTDPDGFEPFPEFLKRPLPPAQGVAPTDGDAPKNCGLQYPIEVNIEEDDVSGALQDETETSGGDEAATSSLSSSSAAVLLVSPGETPPLVPQMGDGLRKAEQLANEVAMCLRTVNRVVIQAGRLVYEAVIRFRSDRAAFSRFIDTLVANNVLTKEQAVLRERAPKLWMLYKIGMYADILERNDIAGVVPDGVSVLYQAARLLEENPGDEKAKTEKLVEQIREGDATDELSRAYLERLTKEAKQAVKSKDATSGGDKTPETHVGYSEQFDVFLLTPSDEDISRLDRDINDEASLPACRRLDEISADNAVILSIAPLSAVPTLVKRTLDGSGFRVSKTYLLQRPSSADVTDMRVVVIAERGRDAVVQMPEGDWLPEDLVDDPVALTEHFTPEARSRLHVFGDQSRDGWAAVVGDDNWAVGGANA